MHKLIQMLKRAKFALVIAFMLLIFYPRSYILDKSPRVQVFSERDSFYISVTELRYRRLMIPILWIELGFTKENFVHIFRVKKGNFTSYRKKMSRGGRFFLYKGEMYFRAGTRVWRWNNEQLKELSAVESSAIDPKGSHLFDVGIQQSGWTIYEKIYNKDGEIEVKLEEETYQVKRHTVFKDFSKVTTLDFRNLKQKEFKRLYEIIYNQT